MQNKQMCLTNFGALSTRDTVKAKVVKKRRGNL